MTVQEFLDRVEGDGYAYAVFHGCSLEELWSLPKPLRKPAIDARDALYEAWRNLPPSHRSNV